MARKQKTVSDIVEEAIVDICDNYCKYPAVYDTREDSGEKDLCEHCYFEYEEELDHLDRCDECSGYGDDCSFDDDGELVSNCDDCPYNNSSADSWDD